MIIIAAFALNAGHPGFVFSSQKSMMEHHLDNFEEEDESKTGSRLA